MVEIGIEKFRQVLNPAFNNLWEVTFDNIPVSNVPKNLSIQARVSHLPGYSNDTTEIWWNKNKVIVSARGNYSGSISMTFEENVLGDIYKFLYAWRQKIHNHLTTKSLTHLGYKCEKVNVKPLTPQGEQIYSVELRGVFISDISEINLDYSSTDPIRFDVTFSYDYWVLKDSDTSSPITISDTDIGDVKGSIFNQLGKLV